MSGDIELERRAQTKLGTVLRGKYRLDSVLGIGGMAVVYRATHRNQAEFAVKMLHPELSIREDIRTRFLREGYAANSVKHPGAVLVVDDDVAEDGAAFIVMELLDGVGCEDLWMRSGNRLPANVALAIGHQLIDVLASAHDKGIVHRDIKPANIFITRDGTVKVLDFGIARARDALSSQAQATGTGMLLGTPAFMAPEQALAKSSEIDGQTDVWAVGATLFSLISGAIVHDGENGPQIMIKAATQAARSIATVAPQTPPQVTYVVDRALAFHKADRWRSAGELRDAIAEASMACFGVAPSRDVIVRHVTTLDAATSATAFAAVHGVPQPLPFAPSAPAPLAFASANPLAPTPHAVARSVPSASTPMPAQAPPANVGGTTASPVSNDRGDAPIVVQKSGSRAGLIVGVALGAVLLLGGVGFAAKTAIDAKSAANVAPPASASSTVPIVAPATSTVTPEPTATAPTTPSATVAASSTGGNAAVTTQKPGAQPFPLRPQAPASAAPSAVTTAATVAPPSAKPAPKPDCTPNYYLDSNGEKHFKPQCF